MAGEAREAPRSEVLSPAERPVARWEQQPGESAKAYEAARLYFELGPNRSLRLVARRLGKSIDTVKEWSARWRWAERAAAWDAHRRAVEDGAREAVLRQAAEEDAAREVARRRAARAMEWELIQAIHRRLLEMLQSTKGTWAPRDMALMLEGAAKLVRMAAGLDEDGGEDGSAAAGVVVKVEYVNDPASGAASGPGASAA